MPALKHTCTINLAATCVWLSQPHTKSGRPESCTWAALLRMMLQATQNKYSCNTCTLLTCNHTHNHTTPHHTMP